MSDMINMNNKNPGVNKVHFSGFTLIELLVTISIIGILAAISIFALQNARVSARDATRKTDVERIASALALYRADCGSYPLTIGTSITGCPPTNTNVYLNSVPRDPSTNSAYTYTPGANNATFEICITLESPPNPPHSCSGGNYRVTNP
jgi:general secretion pathway protein G